MPLGQTFNIPKQLKKLSIIPILENSKKPAVKWESYQHLKYPTQDLEKWEGNFAVICGKVSSNLVVVDFDSAILYEKFFPKISTFTVQTPGGGYHLYFFDSSLGKKIPRYRGYPVDIQAEASYVLIPPSKLQTGEYVVVKDVAIQKANIISLLDSCLPLGEERPADIENFKKRIDLSEVIKRYVAPALTGKGYWQGLCPFHGERNPSFTVYQERYYCFSCGASGDSINFIMDREHLSFREAIDFLSKEFGIPSPFIKGKERKYFNESGKSVYEAFVEGVMEEYQFITASDNEQMYWYCDGYYREGAEVRIKEWIEKIFKANGQPSRVNFTNEVIEAVKRRTYIDRGLFNPKGFVNVTNGLLNIKSGDIYPHNPDTIMLNQLPVNFDEKADCPKFKKFLGEIVTLEDSDPVQRMFGYCLYPANEFQKAFLLVGGGCNGKSTLLGILTAMLGKRNVASESLQTLSAGRFSPASLYGKMANICADIPTKPIEYTGTFKMLTGGDLIRGERKYEDVFYFVNAAKLIFSANQLPIVNDSAVAFWRRWIVIDFPNSFEGKEDISLLERLVGQELSGILNFALVGLSRLLNEKGFGAPTTMADQMEQWKKNSDSVYFFVGERMEPSSSGHITKEALYSAYCDFCDEQNIISLAKNEFAKRLAQRIRVRAVRKTVMGQTTHCWEGIKFKDGE